MKLFPPGWLMLSEYDNTYRVGDELLGYWPCSIKESYYSCRIFDTEHMRCTPVFWILNKTSDMAPYEVGNYLYFKGCDDGSYGMKFDTREEALKWLDECEIVDYAELVHLHQTKGLGLEWFN